MPLQETGCRATGLVTTVVLIDARQLRDHEARLGRTFAHDDYFEQLSSLRDQLKAGLSQAPPAPDHEPVPVAELAERIKALKAAHTIDAAPERIIIRRIAAEVPVTARIRRRIEPPPSGESNAEHAVPPEATPAIEAEASSQVIGPEPLAIIPPILEMTRDAQAPAKPDYRQRQADRRRRYDRQ